MYLRRALLVGQFTGGSIHVGGPIRGAETCLKPWPNDANIFAQQIPTMLGINVGIVWPPMLCIVG